MVSTTLLSCCLASAFVFYYELSILHGLILIKLSFPFPVRNLDEQWLTHNICSGLEAEIKDKTSNQEEPKKMKQQRDSLKVLQSTMAMTMAGYVIVETTGQTVQYMVH